MLPNNGFQPKGTIGWRCENSLIVKYKETCLYYVWEYIIIMVDNFCMEISRENYKKIQRYYIL